MFKKVECPECHEMIAPFHLFRVIRDPSDPSRYIKLHDRRVGDCADKVRDRYLAKKRLWQRS